MSLREWRSALIQIVNEQMTRSGLVRSGYRKNGWVEFRDHDFDSSELTELEYFARFLEFVCIGEDGAFNNFFQPFAAAMLAIERGAYRRDCAREEFLRRLHAVFVESPTVEAIRDVIVDNTEARQR